LDVPKAQNVAVVVGSEWTQLDQKEPGSWHGEVSCLIILLIACLCKEMMDAEEND